MENYIPYTLTIGCLLFSNYYRFRYSGGGMEELLDIGMGRVLYTDHNEITVQERERENER